MDNKKETQATFFDCFFFLFSLRRACSSARKACRWRPQIYPVTASATKVSTTHAESAPAPSFKPSRSVDRRVLAMDWGIISTPPPLRPPPPSSSRWPCLQRLKVRRPFGWKLHLRRAHCPVSVFFFYRGERVGGFLRDSLFFLLFFFVLLCCFAILRICLFVCLLCFSCCVFLFLFVRPFSGANPVLPALLYHAFPLRQPSYCGTCFPLWSVSKRHKSVHAIKTKTHVGGHTKHKNRTQENGPSTVAILIA